MSTTIADAPPAPRQATAARPRVNRLLARLRAFMLTLVSAAVAFGVLAGLIGLGAATSAYNEYHTLVSEGSVSVDAALRARALALDHTSAEATFLETSGVEQQNAANEASANWTAFNEQARISWRNTSDPLHGETGVFTAADAAANDYIQQIGAMHSYAQAGQTAQAGTLFLSARDVMNTRLVPALGGLEAVKVEMMEATYAGAKERIAGWRNAVIFATALLLLFLLGMMLAVRLMHYRWSWPVGLALGLVLFSGFGLQAHLASAATDAQVLVRQSYDNVAGVQDMAALLSQERALDSIIVFDPTGISGHLADFEQYNTLIEQRLCGPRDCTAQSFLSASDTIDATVADAARQEQSKLGLARPPLVAAVYFPDQARRYEEFRLVYRDWLTQHNKLVAAMQADQQATAAGISSGEGAQTYARLAQSASDATQVARNEFDTIWQRIYDQTPAWQLLVILFPLSGALAAWGVWRRRNELLG